jgi:perosamine synthetase
LEQLDYFIKKRVEIFQLYSALFDGCEHVKEQHVRLGNVSANWLYTFCLEGEFAGKRDLLMSHLKARGIDTRPVFYPMNEMPAFEPHIDHGEFPVSRAISYSGLSLPSSISLTRDEMTYVVDSVLEFFKDN